MEYLPFARPTVDEETVQAVADVLRSGWLSTGPRAQEFEAALSAYCGGRQVRCFTSATEALEIALRVSGIGVGDEVIVPALTFAATANVVVRVGATPVFADVDRSTRNIDVEVCARLMTERTKAIMPVHFAGLPADLDAIHDLAARYRLRVIEDAAHAIGSRFRGRVIGSFGDMTCFSFHPNKNITSIEGGALVTDDAQIVEQATLQRFHGIQRGSDGAVDVVIAGGKSNLSDVAACVGLGQLRRLDEFNATRASLVARYLDQLRETTLELPVSDIDGHNWHMFAPLLPPPDRGPTREAFIEAMRARGIGVGIHYPAVHELSFYRDASQVDCPNASYIGRHTVTLPLFPAMSAADVDRVCKAVHEILGSRR